MEITEGASGKEEHAGIALGEAALRAVLEGLPDATVAVTRDGVIAFVNGRAEELFGFAREELVGRPVQAIWPARVRERYTRNMRLYFATEHPLRFTTEAWGLRRDGSEFAGEMTWGIVETDGGPLLLAIGRDVSDARRRAAQQRAVALLGERALGGADVGDLCQEAIERLRETLPVTGVEIRSDAPAEVLAAWGDVGGAPLELEIHTGDERFGALAVATSIGAEEQSYLRSVANVLATAMMRLRGEERMRHEALHDPLTGLPNRALFRDRLAHALARAARGAGSAGVLFVDLDGFKQINDVYGHAAGDALLIAVGGRLEAAVRPADTVARLGGDEFVVVCEDVDEITALSLGRRLDNAIAAPLVVDGVEHLLTGSIGIALGESDAADPDALLAEADAAAYRAKSAGRARIEVYDASLRERAAERLRTAEALDHALARGELRLAFQPIVRLDDGEVVAHEALLRWDRPGGGASAPGDFIPVAEESALIVEIGAWALREACLDAARAAGEPAAWVNLSARQIADPELPALVERTLRETGLPAGRLRFEAKEAVLAQMTPAATASLDALSAMGVRLVLDDFGTGQSSLVQLRDLPVVAVKVDRSFVARLTRSDTDRAIIAAFVSLGAALGLAVVAEGVETEAQAGALRALGAPLAQGYLFGGPRPR